MATRPRILQRLPITERTVKIIWTPPWEVFPAKGHNTTSLSVCGIIISRPRWRAAFLPSPWERGSPGRVLPTHSAPKDGYARRQYYTACGEICQYCAFTGNPRPPSSPSPIKYIHPHIEIPREGDPEKVRYHEEPRGLLELPEYGRGGDYEHPQRHQPEEGE